MFFWNSLAFSMIQQMLAIWSLDPLPFLKPAWTSGRGLQYKSRKSRDTWINRQIWTWSAKWSRAKANRVFLREHIGHSKHPFQKHKRLYTWTSPDCWYWNQIDYILCHQIWRSSIQLAKTRLGADCDSDHEFLIGKFRLKFKKVEKTSRPFRYDLNQIP